MNSRPDPNPSRGGNGGAAAPPAGAATSPRVSPEIATKARSFLASSRVHVWRVNDTEVMAFVAGDHDRYGVGHTEADGWKCTCPARKTFCSHVEAVRLVTHRG